MMVSKAVPQADVRLRTIQVNDKAKWSEITILIKLRDVTQVQGF